MLLEGLEESLTSIKDRGLTICGGYLRVFVVGPIIAWTSNGYAASVALRDVVDVLEYLGCGGFSTETGFWNILHLWHFEIVDKK